MLLILNQKCLGCYFTNPLQKGTSENKESKTSKNKEKVRKAAQDTCTYLSLQQDDFIDKNFIEFQCQFKIEHLK